MGASDGGEGWVMGEEADGCPRLGIICGERDYADAGEATSLTLRWARGGLVNKEGPAECENSTGLVDGGAT